MDRKSHSGSKLSVGDEGPVHQESKKQVSVTKSSMEAEVIATSDCANAFIQLRNYLIGQGCDAMTAIIYQDNQSCITMMSNGKSTSKEYREAKVFILIFARTELMGAANALTKPVQHII